MPKIVPVPQGFGFDAPPPNMHANPRHPKMPATPPKVLRVAFPKQEFTIPNGTPLAKRVDRRTPPKPVSPVQAIPKILSREEALNNLRANALPNLVAPQPRTPFQ